MSDNIVEITETSNYTISIDTSLVQNENNIIIDLSTPNSVDIINNTTTLIGDLPQGYPLSWTTESLPISRVSGLIGQSGIYYNNGIIGISGIPYSLVPVHDIIAGSGIGITNNNGVFNVSVTGNFGLTSEEVDDKVYDLLKAGNYTNIVYNDSLNTLTISVTGLQPSGSYSLAGHNHSIIEVSGLQIALDSKQPSGNYASSIHSHNSNDIIDFNSSVSGLLPVKHISSGSGILVINNSGNFTVAVTGQFGLTGEEVDDRINNLLVSGPYINLNYNDNTDALTISVTGIQPSGNYANVDHNHIISHISGLQIVLDNKQPLGSYASGIHTHLSSDISDFNNSVVQILPVTNILGSSGIIVSNSGTTFNIVSSGLAFNSGANFDSLSVTGIPVSISGHSHSYSDISDWANGIEQEVHTLLVAGNNINIIYDSIYDTLTINATGLQPSGNYSVVGHNHSIADITNLQSSLDLKAPINSPSFSGIPTAPTASSGTNNNQIASTAFVRNEISNLVDSAPNTLDTLNELAAALGDDPNFATTITNLISNKVNKSGDTITGTLIISPTGATTSGLIVSINSETNLQNTLTIDSDNYLTIYGHNNARLSTEDNSIEKWFMNQCEIIGSSGDFASLKVNNIPVSVSGHSHNSNDITNFNTSVSGLLPSIVGSGYVNLSVNNNSYTISVTGLQPSGNYSLVGHTHASSQITDFNSSVSGLLPTIANSGNNKILTSTGSSVGINAENNLTFDGNLLKVIGSIESSGEISAKTSSYEPEDILLFYGDNYWDGTVFSVDGRGAGYFQYGLSVDGYLNVGGNVNFQGSGLLTSNINNFDSSVSGLLPVKNIVSGTGIAVSNTSGIYTINSIVNEVQQAASLVTNVFNKTANTIPKGSVVYINGGQGDQPTIELAIASTETGSSKTYGITAENISSMSAGKVIVAGALTGFNTDQYNPSAPQGNVNGVTLWLSPVASGAMTTTKPSAPYHMVSVGTIVRTHQNEGVIEVRIQNGFELEELHNVAISGVSNGQFLQYNSSSGLWIPSSSGNFSILRVNGTGVSIDGHTHTSSEITDFNNTVSGLLPSVTGSTYINSSFSNNIYTISATGLQPLLTNPVTGVGVSGYLAKWDESDSISSGNIYDDGTNVGIGTDTPTNKLSVVGGEQVFSVYGNDLTYGGQPPTINLKGYTWFGKSDGSVGIGAHHADSTALGSPVSFFLFEGFNENVTQYNPMCLSAGNFPQVYLDTNGNIGIQTATPVYTLDVNGSGHFSQGLYVNNVEVSVSGHPHVSTDISDFNSSVSGLLPITNILGGTNISIVPSGTEYTISVSGQLGLTAEEVDDRISNLLLAGSGIVLNYDDNTNSLTISTSGLQPSGNYANSIHNHVVSDITDFSSGVSGLLPTISNSGDNRILTSTGSSVGINAENNLTFDGNTLNIDGNITFDSFTESLTSNGNSSSGVVLSLASGTVHTCTLTNNCIFTMPSTVAGKSFTLFLNTGTGNYTASFSGVLWNDNSPPTITTASNKTDIFSFISDGSYWYGSYSQNYG